MTTRMRRIAGNLGWIVAGVLVTMLTLANPLGSC